MQKYVSAVNLLDSPGGDDRVTTTPLRIFTGGGGGAGMADYDDLPPEHKPVLPPKAPQQQQQQSKALFQKRSTGNLLGARGTAGQLDPVQVALHAQVMSKSANNLSATTSTFVSPHTLKISVPSSPLQVPIPAKRKSLCQDEAGDVTITHRNPSREDVVAAVPVPAKRTARKPPVPAVRRRSLAAEDYDEPMSHSGGGGNEFEDYDIPAIRHARASSIKNQKRK